MQSSLLEHTATIRVRYVDTDAMGVVYNGNYARYFEIGRTELLRSIGIPYVELEQQGVLLPVLELHVEFRQPARYDDVLSIRTHYLHDHTVATIRLTYEVVRDGAILATGYTVHSFVSASTWRVVRPPRRFIEAVTRETP